MTKVQATISSFWSKGSEKKTKPRTDDGEGVADSTERKRARKENVQSSNSAVLKDGEADGKVHKTEAESIQRDAEAKKVDAEKETTTEERTTAEKAVAVRKLNSESRKGNEGAEGERHVVLVRIGLYVVKGSRGGCFISYACFPNFDC
mmetsp:Transcript_41746/g.163806  ORF Transcript_41746/g.163806 Transcript_41746/m.163806 type:complete len:148 (-) Transcript_41746:3-446(-)